MDCSPPGSSIHGNSKARILKQVAISFARGLFPTQGLNPCLQGLLEADWQVDSLPLSHLGRHSFQIIPSLRFGRLSSGHRTGKRSVFIPIPKKGNAKECSNHHTIALISHASKVMLKIFQARVQQYMNHELPDVQAGFRKGRGTRDQIANIRWIIKQNKRVPEKIYFCLLTTPKPLTAGITTTLENSS